MDLAGVQKAYRAADREEVDPDEFRRASHSYANAHPDIIRQAAKLYSALGAEQVARPPIGDEYYVAGLFELALRQPAETQVSRVTSMAVGVAAIPEGQLGKMAPDSRYLLLHGAAELAQSFAADLGRTLVREHAEFKRSQRKRITPFGWMMIGSIGASLMLYYF